MQRRLQREAIMRLLQENLLPLNALNVVRGNQSQKGKCNDQVYRQRARRGACFVVSYAPCAREEINLRRNLCNLEYQTRPAPENNLAFDKSHGGLSPAAR